MGVTITNLTPNDDWPSTDTYTVPANAVSVAFHAQAGWVQISTSSTGATYWTLNQGDKEELAAYPILGETFYFKCETDEDNVEVRTLTRSTRPTS